MIDDILQRLIKGDVLLDIKNLRRKLSKDIDVRTFEGLFKRYIINWDIESLKIILKDYGEFLDKDKRFSALAAYYLGTLKLNNLRKILKRTHPLTRASVYHYLGYPYLAHRYFDRYFGKYDNIPSIYKIAYATFKLYMGHNVNFEKPSEADIFTLLAYKFFNSLRFSMMGDIKSAIKILEEYANISTDKGFLTHAFFSIMQIGLLSNRRSILDIVEKASKTFGNKYISLRARVYKCFLLKQRCKIPKALRLFRVILDFNEGLKFPDDLKELYNILWYSDKVRDGRIYLSFSRKLRLMKGRI